MLIDSSSSPQFAKKESGGKGYNLFKLTNAGFQVPPWVVLPASHFDGFLNTANLKKPIQNLLESLGDSPSQHLIESTSKQIEEMIMNATLPATLEQWIEVGFQRLKKSKNTLLAVRSSGVDEDSSHFSFAGQLSTFLNVLTIDQVRESVKGCYASGFSERGLTYRIQNKIPFTEGTRVAVVIQEMIESEKSGVLFTCDPIQGDPKVMTLNSVYGIGEGLVSGELDADTFIIEKNGFKLKEETLAEKEEMIVRASIDGGTKKVAVPPEQVHVSSLTTEEIRTIAEVGARIEAYCRHPQDIEWAIQGGVVYLLQTRPVTTPVQSDRGTLNIWDNSNIVESYGGLTLPLTFSFAHHVYHWVYVQFCEILLIPSQEIRKMDGFLKNMLGLYHGRVYYNILNWYKLTSILPGFKYNRSFMETMMGTSHSLADEIAERIKPPAYQQSLGAKIRQMITGLKFFYFHLTIQTMVDRFLTYFHSVYSEYRHRDYSQMDADQIYTQYQELEEKLLMKWHAPIVNDYLCMVHFGLLKKLCQTWLSDLGPSIQNDLLCGEGKLESAEPTRELIRMAADVQKSPELKKLLELTPHDESFEALKQSPHKAFFQRVERYIDLYGFRCMNEMKLEEKDLYQDSSFLFACLGNYLRTGQTDLEEFQKREKMIRSQAEAKVDAKLKGLKKSFFLWSLKHARKAVKNRENTRFCRTRIYGVARAMFHGIGLDFTLKRIINRPEDIFYLEMKEIAGALEGTLTTIDLKAQIELRKSQYQAFEKMDPPSRFATRGPVYWLNTPVEPDAPVEDTDQLPLLDSQLKGVGCCPGIIEGTVKVILSPKDNMNLNKEILVTLRTDPGWIPLYPSASALLVERGGLLSHSAIVAREMGLPTVVGIKGLTQKIKSGMKVRINGETGLIEILENPGESA